MLWCPGRPCLLEASAKGRFSGATPDAVHRRSRCSGPPRPGPGGTDAAGGRVSRRSPSGLVSTGRLTGRVGRVTHQAHWCAVSGEVGQVPVHCGGPWGSGRPSDSLVPCGARTPHARNRALQGRPAATPGGRGPGVSAGPALKRGGCRGGETWGREACARPRPGVSSPRSRAPGSEPGELDPGGAEVQQRRHFWRLARDSVAGARAPSCQCRCLRFRVSMLTVTPLLRA